MINCVALPKLRRAMAVQVTVAVVLPFVADLETAAVSAFLFSLLAEMLAFCANVATERKPCPPSSGFEMRKSNNRAAATAAIE